MNANKLRELDRELMATKARYEAARKEADQANLAAVKALTALDQSFLSESANSEKQDDAEIEKLQSELDRLSVAAVEAGDLLDACLADYRKALNKYREAVCSAIDEQTGGRYL